MTHNSYQMICDEASRRMQKFRDMDAKANVKLDLMRKEDSITYWVAVVAWEWAEREGPRC